MSSFLALRYVEDADKTFFDEQKREQCHLVPEQRKYLVSSADDADVALNTILSLVRNEKVGLLLSGGMDSAILASYLRGCDAYTFRFLGGSYQKDELERAEYYAGCYNLKLHYVDIDWNIVESTVDDVMITKKSPVHSIEPQICHAARQAKADGISLMIIGNGSDYVFAGMDRLYSTNWTFDGFMKRYIYVNPDDVLINPVSMNYLFERYRIGARSIDYIGFLNDIAVEESYLSYQNAFLTAGMPYIDPYMFLKMSVPLDLERIRRGESKYIIRNLFKKKYPEIQVPEKIPMPRPVDDYFASWAGPVRPEFKYELRMNSFTGNQKWLLWCLERYLNIYD